MDSYECKLSEIADVRIGYQARGRIEENLNGDFVVIRSQDFDKAGNINYGEALRFFPPPKIDAKNYLVTAGDILVQARGQSHLAYVIVESLNNTVAANTFYIIRIIDQNKIAPAFLVWWINQPIVQAYFKQEQGISTIPFISKSVLAEAPVRVPPTDVQKNVTKLNLLWRREQALLEELTYKKENLIQAVARKAVAESLEDKND